VPPKIAVPVAEKFFANKLLENIPVAEAVLLPLGQTSEEVEGQNSDINFNQFEFKEA